MDVRFRNVQTDVVLTNTTIVLLVLHGMDNLFIFFLGQLYYLPSRRDQAFLLATANGMNYGVKKTVGTILGDLSANLLQMTCAALGLATVVIQSGFLFTALKWAGVCYLIFMGIMKIIKSPTLDINVKLKDNKRTFIQMYREGFFNVRGKS